MNSAFRYSGREYNDALLSLGSVRIGTLYDFRRSEHKRGISDGNEGRKTVSHYAKKASTAEGDTIHTRALKEFNAVSYDENVIVKMEDVNFHREFDHPDMYVHCSSFEYAPKVMEQFEGADSCVEITDLRAFYKRLTETLRLFTQVDFMGVTKVTYMDRNEPWNGTDWAVSPALIKEYEFRQQFELRAVWWSKTTRPIQPICMHDIELVKFCTNRRAP
jgi:hypothetical protein